MVSKKVNLEQSCEIIGCNKDTFYSLVKANGLKKDSRGLFDKSEIEKIANSRKAVTKPLTKPQDKAQDDKKQLIAFISAELKKLTAHADIDNIIIERYANALMLDKQIQAELSAGFISYTPQGAEMPRAIFSIKRDNDKVLKELEKVLGIGQANRQMKEQEKSDEMSELINA